MDQKKSVLLLKVLLWLGASAPGAWLIAGVFQDRLGANPIEKLTHVTGMTALILLLLTLSITPLRRMTGWNPVIKLRRPMGLFAFFYAFSHFTVGFSAFVILIPLALTSTRGWIRRLGKRWAVLHRGVYVAAILGVVHFFWLVKADLRLPLLFAAALVVLFGFRVTEALKKRQKASP